jgi:hypothetical protein
MLPMSFSDAETSLAPQRASGQGGERIGRGLICSALLHGLAALLIAFALSGAPQAPPDVALVVPVDLVRLGERSAAPPRQQPAALPQQEAPEISSLKPANPVPEPQMPPPPPEPRAPQPKAPEADPLAALTLRARTELPKQQPAQRSHAVAAVRPARKPPPVDDLAARLESLARLRQPQAQVPPSPRQQDDLGLSNVTASNSSTPLGRQATYGVKDFIRAQIERHWYFDRASPGADDLLISIHLVLNGDGSVGSVSIVDDGSYSSNVSYRSVAISLRNAAWMSSPLKFPADRYDDVKDMILEFSPKDVSR